MKRFPVLHKLNKSDMETLTTNMRLSNHACARLKERYSTNDIEVFKNHVRNSTFGYVAGDRVISVELEDGCVALIAQDRNNYFVITIKEPSINKISLQKKYKLACKGGRRW